MDKSLAKVCLIMRNSRNVPERLIVASDWSGESGGLGDDLALSTETKQEDNFQKTFWSVSYEFLMSF